VVQNRYPLADEWLFSHYLPTWLYLNLNRRIQMLISRGRMMLAEWITSVKLCKLNLLPVSYCDVHQANLFSNFWTQWKQVHRIRIDTQEADNMHFGSGLSRYPPLLIDRPKQCDLHQLSRFYCSNRRGSLVLFEHYANVDWKDGKSKCYWWKRGGNKGLSPIPNQGSDVKECKTWSLQLQR